MKYLDNIFTPPQDLTPTGKYLIGTLTIIGFTPIIILGVFLAKVSILPTWLAVILSVCAYSIVLNMLSRSFTYKKRQKSLQIDKQKLLKSVKEK
jgi:membrane protein implicated in regulation of membrane protease activity